MSTNTSIYTPTNNDEEVKGILKKYPKLQHLREALNQNIATLNYDLIKGKGLNATLDLLSQYSRITLLDEKILKIKPTDAPLPRSIRIKIELTSPLEETCETPEFKTLQDEAENIKLHYQQKMRQLITKTLDIDKSMLKKRLRESFFDHATTLIETKLFYELQMAPEESNIYKIFKANGGSKTAAAYICLKIFEDGQHYTTKLYQNFEKLEKYLGTTKDAIKEGILSHFDKEEAEKLHALQTSLEHDIVGKYTTITNDIINYCANGMTSTTITQHNNEIKKRNAIATTTATFNSKKTEETTATVASAIAKEGSMSTKTMEDFINKRIKESIAKNFECGRDNKNSVNAKGKQDTSKSTSKKRKHGKDYNKSNNSNSEHINKKKKDIRKKRPQQGSQGKGSYRKSKKHQQPPQRNQLKSKNKSWNRNAKTNNQRKRGNDNHEESPNERNGKRKR